VDVTIHSRRARPRWKARLDRGHDRVANAGLAGILDRQIMQSELRLQALQEIRARLPQSDPHDVPWPLRSFASFFDGDIFDAASAGIHARGDDAGFAVARRRLLRVGSDVHSFPQCGTLFYFEEYSHFTMFCRLLGQPPTASPAVCRASFSGSSRSIACSRARMR